MYHVIPFAALQEQVLVLGPMHTNETSCIIVLTTWQNILLYIQIDFIYSVTDILQTYNERHDWQPQRQYFTCMCLNWTMLLPCEQADISWASEVDAENWCVQVYEEMKFFFFALCI